MVIVIRSGGIDNNRNVWKLSQSTNNILSIALFKSFHQFSLISCLFKKCTLNTTQHTPCDQIPAIERNCLGEYKSHGTISVVWVVFRERIYGFLKSCIYIRDLGKGFARNRRASIYLEPDGAPGESVLMRHIVMWITGCASSVALSKWAVLCVHHLTMSHVSRPEFCNFRNMCGIYGCTDLLRFWITHFRFALHIVLLVNDLWKLWSFGV